jgi:Na+/H+ antiporter NhaD/arsenite permease-like protein
LAALLVDAVLWAASGAAALVVVAVFAVRRREALCLSLVPWRLLVLVPGMFLVVETVNVHGLHEVLRSAMGAGGSLSGLWHTAGVGAGLSNVLNNLPVYLAGEAAVPRGNDDQLLALLVGTNVGSVVTPWASLAILLWFERCRRFGVRVPLGRFVGTGLVLGCGGVAAAVAALWWTR